MVTKNAKKIQKAKKWHPRFKRTNQGRTKRSRIEDNWKHPRGTGNKQLQKLRQAGKWPTIGYKNAAAVSGVHPCGQREILVYNAAQLGAVDKKMHVVRIGGAVGAKKRTEIVAAAAKAGIHVLNKNIRKKIKRKNEQMI